MAFMVTFQRLGHPRPNSLGLDRLPHGHALEINTEEWPNWHLRIQAVEDGHGGYQRTVLN